MPTTDKPALNVRPPGFPRSRWWRMSRQQRREYRPPSFLDVFKACEPSPGTAAAVNVLAKANPILRGAA